MSTALGQPGVGIHTHIGGIALGDVVLTALGAVVIGHFTGYRPFIVFLFLMLVSIPIHWAFGVPTVITTGLGFVDKPASV